MKVKATIFFGLTTAIFNSRIFTILLEITWILLDPPQIKAATPPKVRSLTAWQALILGSKNDARELRGAIRVGRRAGLLGNLLDRHIVVREIEELHRVAAIVS
jgi:hypothetical protein